MNLSPRQDHAIRRVNDWMRGKAQLFRLFGYAGTGKTTIAKRFAENVSGPVYFASFTWKAAIVMQKSGCSGACSIHSLIYLPKSKSREHLIFLKEQLAKVRAELLEVAEDERDPLVSEINRLSETIRAENENVKKPFFVLNPDSPLRDASLLIVDECSMVNEDMALDIMSFGCKVLVLGDPAQLPPSHGKGYFTNAEPDVMLTDIHRQARDNPIIELATRIREGGNIEIGSYGESRVMDWADVEPDEVNEADQIIVGRNTTRRGANNRIREMRKYEGSIPVAGERLICLTNHRDLGLFNGSIWYLKNRDSSYGPYHPLNMTLESDDGDESYEIDALVHQAPFFNKELSPCEYRMAAILDYGYAITCHKAQGSQYPHPFIFDESKAFRHNAWRWRYTAVTRAAEKVTIAI